MSGGDQDIAFKSPATAPAATDPLRIALVILHANPGRGGAERYTLDLANALRAGRQHVSIVASSFDPIQQHADDVHLDASSGTRTGRYLKFLDRLDRHLSANRYDVVHAMLPAPRCDLYHPHAGMAAEAIANGHLKYESRMMQMMSRVATRLNGRRKRFAAIEQVLLTGTQPPIVLCLSEYVKRTVSRHYPMLERRLAVLFNAVDLKRFDPGRNPDAGIAVRQRFGLQSDRTVALMIAHDFARKGLAESLLAIKRAGDAAPFLLVVGKQDPSRYRAMAEHLGLGRQVIFAGPTDDPYAFYRAADFFLLPTRHDPCSLVVLEALAMGLPVISTVRNGACEIMTSGEHGYVVNDPADVESISAAIRSLCDREARAAMASHCLALRPRLAYERHLATLLEMYRTVRNGASV